MAKNIDARATPQVVPNRNRPFGHVGFTKLVRLDAGLAADRQYCQRLVCRKSQVDVGPKFSARSQWSAPSVVPTAHWETSKAPNDTENATEESPLRPRALEPPSPIQFRPTLRTLLRDRESSGFLWSGARVWYKMGGDFNEATCAGWRNFSCPESWVLCAGCLSQRMACRALIERLGLDWRVGEL